MGIEAKFTMNAFRNITRAIAGSDNLETMTSLLTQLLVTHLEIKGCAIYFLNPEAGELEMLASFGLSPAYLTKGPVSADKSIKDAFKGKAVLVSDTRKDTSLQYPKEAEREGIRAIISVPIVFAKETMGVLRLYHHEIWKIPEQDVDSLQILAEMIGLALSYTRLLNAVQDIADLSRNALPLPKESG